MTASVLMFPQMVVCPLCFQSLILDSRNGGEFTYLHQAGALQCPNTGHKFTFQLPSVDATES